MKKTALILTAALMISVNTTAIAENGDVKQPYYTTDILTYMDGIPIQGYSLNGRMMIELEALESYGFSVSYDESVRTLFVNKTNEPYENFHPHYSRGVEGNIAGYTYETDIKAYVNGNYIPTESINGRLLAVAEDLGRVVKEPEYILVPEEYAGSVENTYEQYGQYDTSRYFMTHTWDAADRKLYLYNTAGNLPTHDERVKMIINEIQDSFPVDTISTNRYGTIITSYDDCWFVWNDGTYTDLKDLFNKYGLTHFGLPKVQNATFAEDRVYMYFDSSRERPTHFASHVFVPYDEGRYCLDTGYSGARKSPVRAGGNHLSGPWKSFR